MSSLTKENEFYRQLIVDHYHKPVNKRLLKTKDSLVFHHYHNSCVDDFYIELTFTKDYVSNAGFEGIGCAIATASIDIFISLIINKSINEVININNQYKAMLNSNQNNEKNLGNLLAFKNVLKHPNRLKCALIISESVDEILLLIKNRKDTNGKQK